MQHDKEKSLSVASILGALTAIITVIGGLLFYIGYLFLLGYYRAFNLRIELLELSPKDIMAESGALLVPLTLFLLIILIFSTPDISEIPHIWRRKIYLGFFAFILVLTLTIPPTGEWFAKRFVSNFFTGYNFLAKPLPSVLIFSKECLPSLPPCEVKNGCHRYQNLRLVAANKDYYFLFNKNMTTYVVPKSAVSVVFLP